MTSRLRVVPWHDTAAQTGRSLAEVVAEILTDSTTSALPPDWQGNYSLGRAEAWIAERDAESPTLLVVDRQSRQPVGLVILAEEHDRSGPDLRIGYVLAQAAWGRALATELVAGLVDWARTESTMATITGGVERSNQASIRVLEKNGFAPLGDDEQDPATFRLDLRRPIGRA